MAEDATQQTPTASKRGAKVLIALAILAALGAGTAGFALAWFGRIPFSGHSDHAAAGSAHLPLPDIAFVPIDAVTIPLKLRSRRTALFFNRPPSGVCRTAGVVRQLKTFRNHG